MSLQPGQTFSHYRIDQKIGEGGMGIVYLAEDTRLGRRIALKVLSSEMSADAGRRARFEREARAIAALNHPNIVTLHSVEESDGISFLTMELVDGRGLSQLLPSEGLALPKLLDFSLGIVDALVAAHRQGVVHRDLKPDNIMVTGDGRIKVLDFGLAKLRESTLEGAEKTALTSSITQEGKILGTAAYMSPEQAEGKPLDHRSDIFSFGIVLYEMAAGQRPFRGDTAISTLSSILKDTPPPAHQINTSLPADLGRIVRRCLAKDPERRYQSTDDLRNELRELKEDSDSGELSAARVAASASKGTGASRLPRAPALFGLVAVLLALAGLAAWLGLRGEGSSSQLASRQPAIQMSRATTDGKVEEAAISPDGRYVAYVRREGAIYALRLRQLVTGDEVQVVAPSEASIESPSFSDDGDYLFYVSTEPGKSSGWAYRVSVLGGTPRRIVDGAATVSVSHDGQKLALTGGTLDESHLRIVSSDGSAPRDLLRRKRPDHFDSAAAWSPDGRSLAILNHRFGEPQQILRIDPETGREDVLSIPSLRSFYDVTWLPGRSSLAVSGSERPVSQRGVSQIWEVSTDGVLEPLTHDLNSYSDLSVTADGRTLAAVQVERRSGIDVAHVRDGVPEAFVELFPISASRAGARGLAWLPGNRLVHTMMQGDVFQVFVTDASSKATRVVTTGVSHYDPVVSRDGGTMVVVREDGDRGNLWRVDPETGREQRLTDGAYDAFQVVSPDGKWVVYSTASETGMLFKIPAEGGTPIELTKRTAWCRDIAADGRNVLCGVLSASGEAETVTIALEGGDARPITGIPATAGLVRFGPDRASISYLITHEGIDELWSLPARGGEPRRLARFEGKEIVDFAWSPDGSRLAVTKASRSGDVVLLKRTGG